ncbi:MAG: acyl carrier protein [Bacteroidales bacterium]|nr:acyl carrier protein [Bacteroidales bacterium]
MTREEIENRTNKFFTETLDIDASILLPESRLKNDIGLTSMDVNDIRLFVEKTFGWSMTIEDIVSIHTLKDLYSSIEVHI